MGRKQRVTYPLDSTNVHRTEQWSYDEGGRLYQFTNRGSKIQTFTYDQLSRITGFSWNDGITPGVSFGYDAASRLIEIDNANAHVSRSYFNDNLLHTETQDLTPIGGVARTITHGYDDDANRGTLQIPGYTFDYAYTGRNQIKNIKNGATALATYNYDENNYVGDLTSRVLNNGTRTDYLYDPLDRVTWITHTLNGATRGFNYGYQDNTNNRKYVTRTGALGNLGDVFNYDLADQVVGVQLNVQTPQSTPTPTPNISYDPNGNRTTFRPYGSYETYTVNDLSAYTSRTILRTTTNAAYDNKGNLTTGLDGSTYVYDAQNRLTSATKSGVNMSFTYDGLNRQVSRTVGGSAEYSTWDGWDLVEEYHGNGVADARYLYGPTGLVKNLTSGNYYYQDGSGSTSHLADSTGHLKEWYRYDLQGAPFFYDSNDTQLSTSNYSVRHLFTGQQWYKEIGLYDLRNRFYSPDIGRFLQADPTGFRGDRTNLYRYCRNNPVTRWDPFGLQVTHPTEGIGDGNTLPEAWYPPQEVTGDFPDPSNISRTGFLPGSFGGFPTVGSDNPGFHRDYNPFPRSPEDDQPSVEHPPPSNVPPQNPTPTVSLGPPLPSVPYTPPINAITYDNYVPINPFTNQPIWFPPGTSLERNIAEAKRMNAFQYYHAVTHKWNYKGAAYEGFRNLNAGATGRAAGFPSGVIQFFAGMYQTTMTSTYDPSWGHWYSGPPWGDDPVDQFMIDWGVRYYNSGGY